MCSLSQEKVVKTTTDIESLRSEIRDKSVRVIDVRREEDYKQNHIPTAVNLPLAKLLSDDSPERVLKIVNSMGIDDETSVVVYDDTFGALASRVAWTLEYLGHSDVSLLETTYSKWKSIGLENDNLVPDVQSKDHSINLKPEILATSVSRIILPRCSWQHKENFCGEGSPRRLANILPKPQARNCQMLSYIVVPLFRYRCLDFKCLLSQCFFSTENDRRFGK